MAEAAGLALGAVALVSLFQTAVECLEYFELARALKHDHELAATKVSLLESRLKEWGGHVQVLEPGREDEGLRTIWEEEGGLITKSLSGIALILGNAAELNQTYGLHKKKLVRCKWSSPFPRQRPGSKLQSTTSSTSQIAVKATASFRRQVVWAIRDKKRFDSLISDLDFLVTNLEKVGERLRSRENSDLDNPRDAIMDSKTCTFGDTRAKFPGRGNTLGAPPSHGHQQQYAPPVQQQPQTGHEFTNPVAESRSQMINGDVGRSGGSNKYDQPHSKAISFMHNGNSESGQDTAAMMNAHGKMLMELAKLNVNIGNLTVQGQVSGPPSSSQQQHTQPSTQPEFGGS